MESDSIKEKSWNLMEYNFAVIFGTCCIATLLFYSPCENCLRLTTPRNVSPPLHKTATAPSRVQNGTRPPRTHQMFTNSWRTQHNGLMTSYQRYPSRITLGARSGHSNVTSRHSSVTAAERHQTEGSEHRHSRSSPSLAQRKGTETRVRPRSRLSLGERRAYAGFEIRPHCLRSIGNRCD